MCVYVCVSVNRVPLDAPVPVLLLFGLIALKRQDRLAVDIALPWGASIAPSPRGHAVDGFSATVNHAIRGYNIPPSPLSEMPPCNRNTPCDRVVTGE